MSFALLRNLSSSFTGRPARRRQRPAVSCPSVVDMLEQKLLLSGTNQAPEINLGSTEDGVITFSVTDDVSASVDVEIDIDNDGTVELSFSMSTGSDVVNDLSAYVPANQSSDVRIKVTESDSGLSAEEEANWTPLSAELVTSVSGRTLEPVQIQGFWADMGYIGGTVNLDGTYDAVRVMYREVGSTQWLLLEDLAYSDILVEIPEADGARDFEFRTEAEWMGNVVYGDTHTVLDLEPWNDGSGESSSQGAAAEGTTEAGDQTAYLTSAPTTDSMTMEEETDFWSDYDYNYDYMTLV